MITPSLSSFSKTSWRPAQEAPCTQHRYRFLIQTYPLHPNPILTHHFSPVGKGPQDTSILPAEVILTSPELSDAASCSDSLSHCLTGVIPCTTRTSCESRQPPSIWAALISAPRALHVIIRHYLCSQRAPTSSHQPVKQSTTPSPQAKAAAGSAKARLLPLICFPPCSSGAKTAFQQICPLAVHAEELGEVCSLRCGCETSCGALPAERLKHSSCDSLCFAEQ